MLCFVDQAHNNLNDHTDIRNIVFTIPGAEGVSFVSSIIDKNDNTVNRNLEFKDGDNAFENFELTKGQNRFIVKTKFNHKVEILIK